MRIKLVNSILFFAAVPIAIVMLMAFAIPGKDDKDYKVIKVNGSIVVKKTGQPLSQGDIFKENTSLQFKTPDAKATVINSAKGRFVLSQSGSGGSNLIPAINNISSRGGAILTVIDLQNLFTDNVCVIDKMKLKIASPDFQMNANRFFYISYKYKGEDINKPLDYSDDSLILDKNKLYKVDGNPITAPDSPQVTLYYRNAEKKTFQSIAVFNLVFPEEKTLKEEVKIILTEFESKDSKQKTEEVLSYLNEFYGKPDRENVVEWLAKEFGLK